MVVRVKLVIQTPGDTKVQDLPEYQLEETIQRIVSAGEGSRVPPLPHEVFRYKLPKGAVVIYGDNKRARTRNFWYEVRGLRALARWSGTAYRHSCTREFPNGLRTEVDGVDVATGTTMVELKQAKITQRWIDYYDHKRARLGFRACHVVAPAFSARLDVPPAVRCFNFAPDVATLMRYYAEQFAIPAWFAPLVPARHVRVLLDTGRWHGIRRKLTTTPKRTGAGKIALALHRLAERHKHPVRLYYSLSPMVRPVAEFQGRGYPLERAVAAFDVDADHKHHVIGPEGYCVACLEDATRKATELAEQLTARGYAFRRVHSGAKGFHFYLVDEDAGGHALEHPHRDLESLARELRDARGRPLTDNVNFRGGDGGFDAHRIFKLPGTVDAVTGVRVAPELDQLPFDEAVHEH